MKSQTRYALSDQDKTPAAHGFGFNFHHAEPQRRVSCLVGDMLCPASADDIAPITPEALASVKQALALLANLVGDRDHNLFLGDADRDGRCTAAAQQIALVAKGLAGILRVTESREISDAGTGARAARES